MTYWNDDFDILPTSAIRLVKTNVISYGKTAAKFKKKTFPVCQLEFFYNIT